MLGDANKLFLFKSLLTMPSNVIPQANVSLIIWIFTEGEGDEIKSRLPFKIFCTLCSFMIQFHLKLKILINHGVVCNMYLKQVPLHDAYAHIHVCTRKFIQGLVVLPMQKWFLIKCIQDYVHSRGQLHALMHNAMEWNPFSKGTSFTSSSTFFFFYFE